MKNLKKKTKILQIEFLKRLNTTLLSPQNVVGIPTDTITKHRYRYYARVEFVEISLNAKKLCVKKLKKKTKILQIEFLKRLSTTLLSPQNVVGIPTDTITKYRYRYYARVEFVEISLNAK